MAKRRSGYRKGPYKFTSRRRYALKQAQLKSARKRKITRGIMAAGGVAAVGTAAYLGVRHREKLMQTASNWRNAVQPGNKEAARMASAIGKVPGTTQIGWYQRLQAQKQRDKMAKAALPPHLGGPDRRKYTEEGDVNTEAMTNQGVRRTLKANKKKTQGKRTATNKPPPKAVKKPGAEKHGGLTEAEWQAALGFEDTPRKIPRPGGSGKANVPSTVAKASVFGTQDRKKPWKDVIASAKANIPKTPGAHHEDLRVMHRKKLGGAAGHHIIGFGALGGMHKALLAEEWQHKGYLVDWETGELKLPKGN